MPFKVPSFWLFKNNNFSEVTLTYHRICKIFFSSFKRRRNGLFWNWFVSKRRKAKALAIWLFNIILLCLLSSINLMQAEPGHDSYYKNTRSFNAGDLIQRLNPQRRLQKNNTRCNDQNKQLCTCSASLFLVHSFDVHCTTTTWNLLIWRFMEEVDIRQRIFLPLFETE